MRSIAFSLLILISLTLPPKSSQTLNGVILINNSTIQDNIQKNLTGVVYEIFKEVSRILSLNVNFTTFDLSRANDTLPKLVANKSIDLVLGYPISYLDPDFDIIYDNISRVDVIRDKMYIFRPNLLQLLVLNVLKEVFFVVFIVLFPWFLINVSLYYLIEIRRFSKMDFFTGFYESFKAITYKGKKMSKCARIYSIIFYILTLVVGMLLLGDFIYVIAAMLLKSDIDNINEFINSQSKICVIQNDFLVGEFLSKKQEIPTFEAEDIKTCFSQLSTFDVGSFLVSESRIKSFFYQFPNQNNLFDYLGRDSIYVDYSILINTELNLKGPIENVINDLKPRFIPGVLAKYYTDPVFDKIVPISIFSDSILLIFTSLTITSLFLIMFLAILICRQARKPVLKKNVKNKEKGGRKSGENFKRYELAKQTDRNHRQRAIDEELESGGAQHYPSGYQQQQYQQQGAMQGQAHGNVQNSNTKNVIKKNSNNHTLSLSGPIQLKKFEGKPEKSWLKIDAQSSREEGSFKFHGTSDFENQISAVEKAQESGRSHPDVFNLEGDQARGETRNRVSKNKIGGISSTIRESEGDQRTK